MTTDTLFPFTRWRKTSLRAIGLCCLLGVLLLLPDLALAQADNPPAPAIRQMNIQVMPEFDDSRVLVVVQGRLAADVALPQTVTFRLPRGAQVNQMAVIDIADGRPAPQPFTLSNDPTDGRWSLATYTITGAHFFFEYYFDPLADNPDKAFTFTVSPLQPVENLVLEVQQPRQAEAFTTQPPAIITRSDSYGLTLYQTMAGALAAGQETAVAIQYRKTDPAPSVLRPTHPAPAAAAPARTPPPFWMMGLGGATAVAALVVGLFSFARWRDRQVATAPPPAPPCSYCPQCGAPQRLDSHYCHACGILLC